jgi:hypothetical protein
MSKKYHELVRYIYHKWHNDMCYKSTSFHVSPLYSHEISQCLTQFCAGEIIFNDTFSCLMPFNHHFSCLMPFNHHLRWLMPFNHHFCWLMPFNHNLRCSKTQYFSIFAGEIPLNSPSGLPVTPGLAGSPNFLRAKTWRERPRGWKKSRWISWWFNWIQWDLMVISWDLVGLNDTKNGDVSWWFQWNLTSKTWEMNEI